MEHLFLFARGLRVGAALRGRPKTSYLSLQWSNIVTEDNVPEAKRNSKQT